MDQPNIQSPPGWSWDMQRGCWWNPPKRIYYTEAGVFRVATDEGWQVCDSIDDAVKMVG